MKDPLESSRFRSALKSLNRLKRNNRKCGLFVSGSEEQSSANTLRFKMTT
jgi:hypothetical protein